MARVVGRNTRRNRDNKKNFKNRIIGSIITSTNFVSINIYKFLKNLKTTFLWTSRSEGGAKRIRIRNRNLQTKITTAFLGVPMLLLTHKNVVFKIFFFKITNFAS